jgi:excisionase family DNA binding protein
MTQYTVAEVAEACQLTRGTIYRAIDEGQLRATAIETTDKRDKWRISAEDLLAYKRWRMATMGDYYPELDQSP